MDRGSTRKCAVAAQLFSVNSAGCLALAIPCFAAAASLAPRPALAISAPDARAVCLAAGGIDVGQSENALACNIVGVGDYRVIIGNAVSACTYVATLGIREPAFRQLVKLAWHEHRLQTRCASKPATLLDCRQSVVSPLCRLLNSAHTDIVLAGFHGSISGDASWTNSSGPPQGRPHLRHPARPPAGRVCGSVRRPRQGRGRAGLTWGGHGATEAPCRATRRRSGLARHLMGQPQRQTHQIRRLNSGAEGPV